MRIYFICLFCFLVQERGVHPQGDDQGGRNVIGQNSLATHTHFTRSGTIIGTIDYEDPNPTLTSGSANQDFFYMFRGIPYGTPPVGERRWKDAEPILTWNRELDATRPRPPCPRPGSSQNIGVTEDCLFLNVFTKNLNKARNTFDQPVGGVSSMSSRAQPVVLPLRPVIVFLPGFTSDGAGSFGANKLMRENLVIVTVEYRVGALGFLSDGYDSVPGNYGISDVILALRWVQQAISDFGGNPRQVTLAGHGQGAVIAHLLSLQASSSSLFHQIILQSGSCFCPGSISRYGEKPITYGSTVDEVKSDDEDEVIQPYNIYKKMLSLTGCSTLKCLKDKSVQDIVRAQTEIEKEMLHTRTVFIPLVDETLRSSPLVFTPSRGTHGPSAILIGTTLHEGYTIAKKYVSDKQGDISSKETIRTKFLPELMRKLVGRRRGMQKEFVEVIFRQYFNELVDGQTTETIGIIANMIGDFLINSCVRETIDFHRKKGSGSIHAYVFSYSSDTVSMSGNQGYSSSMYRMYSEAPETPIPRGTDLHYLWTMQAENMRTNTPTLNTESDLRYDERLVSKNMTNIWDEFAKSGIPSPVNHYAQGLPSSSALDAVPIVWSRVEKQGQIGYYNISLTKDGMFYDYKKYECTFWLAQARYVEILSARIFLFKGFMVATIVLSLLFLASLGAIFFFVFQIRRNKQKMENGSRGYSGWLANMSSSAPSALNQCS
ncbi:esterase E4 isoform X2 [Eurytemora carolleeae]|uniref:esterase E4 isoform X2 n=1 Tax=Eurytemora carolleeae TaxID=1294199 RepID=UPI000C773140|nr:esterase E4 isoform X2 [Eurytemora carolleeae]|eukprot:XP_023347307.1 esterase E4-like isoform X2 [Eurytemora affinis]